VEYLPEKYNAGKIAVNEKMRECWLKYQHLWDPILYAACRLNPAMNVQLIMEPEEVKNGDHLIFSQMKTPNPIHIVELPTKKNRIHYAVTRFLQQIAMKRPLSSTKPFNSLKWLISMNSGEKY